MKNMANPYVENDYQIGEILCCTWGYDQTNVDFYQVVGKTAKTIKVREIEKTVREFGFMCGYSVPIRDAFVDEPYYGDGRSEFTIQCRRALKAPKYGWMSRWSGRPVYTSWYA